MVIENSPMPPKNQEILEKVYSLFNERNIDDVLQYMHSSVLWPNGWEGGYIKGKAEVRDYWERQLKEFDPYVDPVNFKDNLNNEIEVDVHQIVKDIDGNVLVDHLVKHVYIIENELIVCMNIVAL